MYEQKEELKLIMNDIKNFIPQLVQASEYAAEMLYVPMTEQSWEQWGYLLQGIDDLFKTLNRANLVMEECDSYEYVSSIFARYSQEISDKFNVLNQFMDAEEYIEAADCIKYEFISLFQSILDALGDEDVVEESRFATNLEYLKSNHKFAYHAIHDVEPDLFRYRVKYSKNGSPNLSITSSDNRALSMYSNYNPEHAVNRWFESIAETVEDKTTVLVYGLGLGYHLLELSRNNPEQLFMVFEPDVQILLAAMRAVDFEVLFSKVNIKMFIAGWNDVVRDESISKLLRDGNGKNAVVSVPIYDKLDAAGKLKFFEDAKTAIMLYDISASTRSAFGLPWLANKVYNVASILKSPSISGLQNKLEGITAVVVGAGPSLEPDIEILRELKDHAFIIAAGTAIQSLRHFGITPHLIVSVDGSTENYNAFKHLDVNEVPFLFAPLIHHSIIEDKKRLFHFLFNGDLTNRYLMGWNAGDPIFYSPPSVTGPAIQAAIYMGCKEVVFTGQDLSYPGAHVYSPGAKHITQEESDHFIRNARMQVENVQGGMNRTNSMMRVTLRELEKFLDKFEEVQFINCSRLGAKIEHAEYQPLESVLQRLKNKKLPADFLINAMDEHLQPYDGKRKQEVLSRITQLGTKLVDMDKSLEDIVRKLSTLRELSRKKPKKCMDQMVQIEEAWGPIMHSELISSMLGVALPDDFIAYDRELPDLVKETNTVKKAELFCKVLGDLILAIRNCIPKLVEIVEETMRRLDNANQIAPVSGLRS